MRSRDFPATASRSRSKLCLPRIDDWNADREKWLAISRGYRKTMQRSNRCDLTIRHRNRPPGDECSRLFARPSDSGSHILIVDFQLGKAGADLVRAALSQRAQNDALPICGYVEILHPAKAGDHPFG